MGLCRQLEVKLTAALAKAAHMERALDAVCVVAGKGDTCPDGCHCDARMGGECATNIQDWALKETEEAK